MSERDEALLKCLEALYGMVGILSAALGERMSESEATSFGRAHGRWNSAHTDLLREMRGDGDE
ncbi:hypothetical protein [Olsenella profusa]|uniref:Uncharacterized protein n=1 Tax=Olsenella profusa F0195 TaxID=1125712 RepID=U2V3C4_9ACTN|nr:hypothetical protein [Olsenella profusa]ERL09842.1 hypothetical protein HMPREF1316_1529 [Olsenella profusa F0195]